LVAAQRFYEKHGVGEIGPADLPAVFPRMAVDTKFYRVALDGDAAVGARALKSQTRRRGRSARGHSDGQFADNGRAP
jgi:hypothetical protein